MADIDLARLRADLADLAGLETQLAADTINARKVPGAIPYADLRQYLQLSGIWTKLLIAKRRPDVPITVQALAETVLDVVSPGNFESFRFHIPEIAEPARQMLGGLVQAGVLTQAELDAVFAMTADRQSYAVASYGREITGGDVERARKA